MLNKNEIINGLSNEDIIVRNGIYEYVCNLHLYDDKDINEKFIEFLKNNYSEINLAGIKYSKINKEIMECFIKIALDDKSMKRKISDILVMHYNLIKDMDYNFEEIIDDKEDLLLYKKIKHFSKKEPSRLIELYKNNINEYYFTDNEEYTTEILRNAIGIALIQTKEGYEKLMDYINELITNSDIEEFTFDHMPYLVYPLCQYAEPKNYPLIWNLYFNNMDFIGYAEECNHYFSNICNEEFVDFYINKLTNLKENQLEDYYYDIAEYLNSNKINQFLFDELKRIKDKQIKENIIRILAGRYEKNVIPCALEFIKKNKYYNDDTRYALAPLLILEKCDDDISKKIIQEDINEEEEIEKLKSELASNFLHSMQNLLLKNKPHIKKYKKIRKLHDEVMSSMMQYLYQGKFKLKIDENIKVEENSEIMYINTKFDTRTEIGVQALSNVMVYKNASNFNCITEEYIKNNRYRNKEKVDLLKSMIESKAGLFEITETDRENGQVHLRNVLNGDEYCITDIGFSSNIHNDKIYIYTRIITYDDISFGSGLHIVFDKKDKFICNWIDKNKKEFNENGELARFIELYDEYANDDKGVNVLSKMI